METTTESRIERARLELDVAETMHMFDSNHQVVYVEVVTYNKHTDELRTVSF